MEASVQPVLGRRQRRMLTRLAAGIVPQTADASPAVIEAALSAVDEQLRDRPRLQQLEFKLLVLGLVAATVLPAGWQAATLRLFENFPLRLVRVGVWGLKTLIYLGYYGQESIQRHIAYVPGMRDGNDRLHAGQLPLPE
jgi:hypothetical protein